MEMEFGSLYQGATRRGRTPNGTDRPMTIAIKSNIVLSALVVFLGLAVASPAAWAFTDQTDIRTTDIDKEDAELGDYSAWNSGADRKDARSEYDLGWTFGFGRPAGSGEEDAKAPAGSAPPVLPVDAPDPEEGK